MKPINISFEFFPPQTDEGVLHLEQTQAELAKINPTPDFFSVTYGAGGTTQERTISIVEKAIKKYPNINIVPHLTCVGTNKKSVAGLLSHYIKIGVNKLVVLRGDLPSGVMGHSLGDFKHAVDLVRFIRAEHANHFHITVACYPEMHPEAENLKVDINYFLEKVSAGADSAMTQFFYNVEAYINFVDTCKKHGVNIPIIPGIMPINKIAQLQRFSKQCGAEIPRWLIVATDGIPEAEQKQIGVEVVSGLCKKLITYGAPSLHFYTLNRSQLAIEIINKIGVI